MLFHNQQRSQKNKHRVIGVIGSQTACLDNASEGIHGFGSLFMHGSCKST